MYSIQVIRLDHYRAVVISNLPLVMTQIKLYLTTKGTDRVKVAPSKNSRNKKWVTKYVDIKIPIYDEVGEMLGWGPVEDGIEEGNLTEEDAEKFLSSMVNVGKDSLPAITSSALWDGMSRKEFRKRCVVINYGLVGYLEWWLEFGGGEAMDLTVIKTYLNSSDRDVKINLLPRWSNQFDTHPRGQYYADAQHDAFKVLVERDASSVELGTGLGKAEIIVAYIDSLINNSNWSEVDGGNILITASSSAACDNLSDRFEQYGLSHLLETGSVKLINPNGWFNSSRATDPDNMNWFCEVTTWIADEAHASSSNAYRKMRDQMKNLIRSHGFSGSNDKANGYELHPAKTPPSSMTTASATTIGNTGVVYIKRSVFVRTDIINLRSEVTLRDKHDFDQEYDSLVRYYYKDWTGSPAAFRSKVRSDFNVKYLTWDEVKIEKEKENEVPWLDQLSLTMCSPRFPATVKFAHDWLTENYGVPEGLKRRVLYVPVHTTNSGHRLAELLWEDHGLHVCSWSGGSVRLNGFPVGSSLETVSNLSEAKLYDVLITTKVAYEAVDLRGITDVLPALGSSFSRVVQPIGRAARSDHLNIVLLGDTSNPYSIARMEKRREVIVQNYNLREVRDIHEK